MEAATDGARVEVGLVLLSVEQHWDTSLESHLANKLVDSQLPAGIIKHFESSAKNNMVGYIASGRFDSVSATQSITDQVINDFDWSSYEGTYKGE